MATEKISQRINKSTLNGMTKVQLVTLLNSAQDDMAAMRTAFATLTAKLDADAGVTDTNYAALCNPAALTFIK